MVCSNFIEIVVSVGRPVGKITLERLRRRCEDNIKREEVDWIHLV
jgi:hypothetical protein